MAKVRTLIERVCQSAISSEGIAAFVPANVDRGVQIKAVCSYSKRVDSVVDIAMRTKGLWDFIYVLPVVLQSVSAESQA